MGRVGGDCVSRMNALPLAILTTRLPPQTCGIGTYSWLASLHRPEGSPPARFIVMEGAIDSRSFLGCPEISEFNGSPKILEQLLPAEPANLLVHYAGRAYDRYGCPHWLPRVLSKWRSKYPENRLTVFFHELPGSISWWSRHYLFGRMEGRVIRQLVGVADVLITNTEHHLAMLRRFGNEKEVHCLPVSSNIETLPGSSEARARTEFILFGLPFGRLQTLRLFDREIRDWQEQKFLTALHLIGPEDEKFTRQANKLISDWPEPSSVVRHGLLPASEVSRVLTRAQFSLTNVTTETWSKSSVFMAAAVTGCGVIAKIGTRDSVPLSYTIDPGEVESISDAELASRTGSLKAWYYEKADWKVTGKADSRFGGGKEVTP